MSVPFKREPIRIYGGLNQDAYLLELSSSQLQRLVIQAAAFMKERCDQAFRLIIEHQEQYFEQDKIDRTTNIEAVRKRATALRQRVDDLTWCVQPSLVFDIVVTHVENRRIFASMSRAYLSLIAESLETYERFEFARGCMEQAICYSSIEREDWHKHVYFTSWTRYNERLLKYEPAHGEQRIARVVNRWQARQSEDSDEEK